MAKEFTLEGKKALITGGSSGLGKATALVFAESGADVAIAARRMNNLEAAAKEIQKEHGRRAVPIQADVSDSAQVDAMVAKATEELGRIDILVNNAGVEILGPTAPLPEPPDPALFSGDHTKGFDDETWHKVIDTNLSSAFYVSRAVAPQMLERRQGQIINISSTSGVLAEPFGAAYECAKAGVKMLTKVLAMEWAQFNVRVNAIAPGWFITEMSKADFDIPEVYAERVEATPLKRLADTRDVGLLALYLACPASDWMTGQFICLDGGEMSLYN